MKGLDLSPQYVLHSLLFLLQTSKPLNGSQPNVCIFRTCTQTSINVLGLTILLPQLLVLPKNLPNYSTHHNKIRNVCLVLYLLLSYCWKKLLYLLCPSCTHVQHISHEKSTRDQIWKENLEVLRVHYRPEI